MSLVNITGQRLVLDLRKIGGEHSNYSITTTRLGREIERIFGAFRTSTHRRSSTGPEGGDSHYHDPDDDDDESGGDRPPSPIIFEMHTRKVSGGVSGDGEHEPVGSYGRGSPVQMETTHHAIEVVKRRRAGPRFRRAMDHRNGAEGVTGDEESGPPNIEVDCGDISEFVGEDHWVEDDVEGLHSRTGDSQSETVTLPTTFVDIVDPASSCIYEPDLEG